VVGFSLLGCLSGYYFIIEVERKMRKIVVASLLLLMSCSLFAGYQEYVCPFSGSSKKDTTFTICSYSCPNGKSYSATSDFGNCPKSIVLQCSSDMYGESCHISY